MSWHRVIVIGVGLVAAAAQAEPSPHVRAGVWRKLAVAPAGEASEVVPELRVAPGSATLLHLPSPILPGGFTVSGGQGRVDVHQVTPTTLVIVPATEVGPERVPLAVATADQRRYPFLMATRPEVVDLEVSVVFSDPPTKTVAQERSDFDLVGALLNHKQVHARQYQRPVRGRGQGRSAWETPYIETAVRMGGRYFIQVANRSTAPWKVQQAKLEGTSGILRVVDIRWQMEPVDQDWNVNVIVAEVPEGTRADYVLTAIELVGEDARVARLAQEVSLP